MRVRPKFVAVVLLCLGIAAIFYYRVNLIESIVLGSLTRQGWGEVQLEIDSVNTSEASFVFNGVFASSSIGFRINRLQMRVRYSLDTLKKRKVSAILVENGSILMIQGKGARTKIQSNKIGLDAVFQALPFEELNVKKVQLSFQAAESQPFEFGVIQGRITADGLLCSVSSGNNEEFVMLQGKRNLALSQLELHGQIREQLLLILSRQFLPPNISLQSGEVAFSIVLSPHKETPGAESGSSPNEISSQIRFSAEKLGGLIETVDIRGGKVSASFSGRDDLTMDQFGEFSAATLQSGVLFENLKGQFKIFRDKNKKSVLQLKNVTVDSFGGKTILERATMELFQPNWEVDLDLQGIDLEQILALYSQPKLAVQGKIDGRVPLRHSRDGFSIERGEIDSATRGFVQLRDVNIGNLAANVTEILENFQFETLQADLSYALGGDLRLKINLIGKNPDWQGGQPVNFNVSVSENIPALIESIRLTRGLTEGVVEGQFSR